MTGLRMNKKPFFIGSIVAPILAINIIYTDVSDEALQQLSDSFRNEWEIQFDSARLNIITDEITLTNAIFPANAVTVEMLTYSYLDKGSDVLPNELVLSAHNVKGISNLFNKYWPEIDLSSVYASAKEEGVPLEDMVVDFSVKLARDKGDVSFYLSFKTSKVQTFTVAFDIKDVFPIMNGAYGRYMRSRIYSDSDTISVIDSVYDSLSSIYDAKGRNVLLHNIVGTHRVDNELLSYSTLSLLPEGTHVDALVNEVRGHRTYKSVEKGKRSFYVSGELNLAEWLAVPVEDSVDWLADKGFVLKIND